MRRTLFAANDFDVPVEQLASVEKLVVIHHPVSEVVNFFEDARGLRVIEIKLAGW